MAVGQVIEGSGGPYHALLVDKHGRHILQNGTWPDVHRLICDRLAVDKDGLRDFKVTVRTACN
jgi:hypothetical protein